MRTERSTLGSAFVVLCVFGFGILLYFPKAWATTPEEESQQAQQNEKKEETQKEEEKPKAPPPQPGKLIEDVEKGMEGLKYAPGEPTEPPKGGTYYPKVGGPVVHVVPCTCAGEGCSCKTQLACGGATFVHGAEGGGHVSKNVCLGVKDCGCRGEKCKCKSALACGGAASVMYVDPKTGQLMEKWVCMGGDHKKKKKCQESGCKGEQCGCPEVEEGENFLCGSKTIECPKDGCGVKGCVCAKVCAAAKSSPCGNKTVDCAKEGCAGEKCRCGEQCAANKTFPCKGKAMSCPCGCPSVCKPVCPNYVGTR